MGFFPKMYTLISFHEGQRSSGAIIRAKIGIFVEKYTFFLPLLYGECINETGHAYRRYIGLVCCIMFARLTKIKGDHEHRTSSSFSRPAFLLILRHLVE